MAHTAHLEAVLAGAPEETVEVPDGAHVKGLTGHYTEQGVLARRDRDMAVAGRRDRAGSRPALRRAAGRSTHRPGGRPAENPGGVAVEHQTAVEQPASRRVDARAGHPPRDRPARRVRLRRRPRTRWASSGRPADGRRQARRTTCRARPCGSTSRMPACAGPCRVGDDGARGAGGRRRRRPTTSVTPEPGGLRRPRGRPARARRDPGADRGRRTRPRGRRLLGVDGRDPVTAWTPGRHPRPDRQARAGHRRHQRHRRADGARARPPRRRGRSSARATRPSSRPRSPTIREAVPAAVLHPLDRSTSPTSPRYAAPRARSTARSTCSSTTPA